MWLYVGVLLAVCALWGLGGPRWRSPPRSTRGHRCAECDDNHSCNWRPGLNRELPAAARGLGASVIRSWWRRPWVDAKTPRGRGRAEVEGSVTAARVLCVSAPRRRSRPRNSCNTPRIKGFRASWVGYRDRASGVAVMTNSDAGAGIANAIVRTVAREYGFVGLGPVERTRGTADPTTLCGLCRLQRIGSDPCGDICNDRSHRGDVRSAASTAFSLGVESWKLEVETPAYPSGMQKLEGPGLKTRAYTNT